MFNFIDTHCHIDSYEKHTEESFDILLKRLHNSPNEQDLNTPHITCPEAFINVACNPNDFEYACKLSEKYPFVYATYGIHPEYVLTETTEDESCMMEYLRHPKCVGCGEFGLDYHYDLEHRKEQLKLFERHLEYGIKSKKTLVLHLREAEDDALVILRNADLRHVKLHIHCFTGTANFAEKLLALDSNVFIGFTGIITFKNAQNVREAAALTPTTQILLETDSPYMAPVPFRGKPSHSGQIPFIAQQIAQIKNMPIENIYKHCRENTLRCYGI